MKSDFSSAGGTDSRNEEAKHFIAPNCLASQDEDTFSKKFMKVHQLRFHIAELP